MKNQIFTRFGILLFAFLLFNTSLFAGDCEGCFVTIWKTDNEGISNDNQITIPGYSDSEYDIFWEEVDNVSNNGSLKGNNTSTITFPSSGIYRVSISANENGFHEIAFDNDGDRLKIMDITQWGDIEWSSFQGAFAGCENLQISASDVPNLTNVTSMFQIFYGATSFNQPIGNWDVSNVTDMSYAFAFASSFNQSIEDWDVSNVLDMSFMFGGATSFNQPIGKWNVSNLQSSIGMFAYTSSFNQPIGDWKFKNLVFAIGMFAYASSFDQPIENWDVSSVEYMYNMFYGAESFNQPIGDWDVSNVTFMDSMFYQAKLFDQSLENWQLNSELIMNGMLSESGLQCDNYNKTLIGWANNPLTPSDRIFGADSVFYGKDAIEAREILISNGWIITDAGLDENCESVSTKINERQVEIASFQVYPNPNNGQFNIEMESNKNIDARLEIINAFGQVVQSQQIKNLNGKRVFNTDLSKLSKGLYLVNLYFNNEIINRRVVIQ